MKMRDDRNKNSSCQFILSIDGKIYSQEARGKKKAGELLETFHISPLFLSASPPLHFIGFALFLTRQVQVQWNQFTDE